MPNNFTPYNHCHSQSGKQPGKQPEYIVHTGMYLPFFVHNILKHDKLNLKLLM